MEPVIRTAVLFADISGSTQLYVQLGDTVAQSVIARSLACLTGVTREHGGQVIKTIGDEIMCRFASADEAFDAGVAMQRRLRSEGGRITDKTRIGIRIGMHWGEAVEKEGDLFGDAVNVAARVAAVAKKDQIVTTEQTVQALNGDRGAMTVSFDRVALKGRTGEIVLCLVNWDDEADATRMRTALPAAAPTTVQKKLVIRFEGQSVSLLAEGQTVTMGRSPECSLVVQTGFASRLHARLVMRRGKFVLVDESTNGSYVVPGSPDSAADEVFIKREEFVLPDSCRISLGQSCRAPEARCIELQIHDPAK